MVDNKHNKNCKYKLYIICMMKNCYPRHYNFTIICVEYKIIHIIQIQYTNNIQQREIPWSMFQELLYSINSYYITIIYI